MPSLAAFHSSKAPRFSLNCCLHFLITLFNSPQLTAEDTELPPFISANILFPPFTCPPIPCRFCSFAFLKAVQQHPSLPNSSTIITKVTTKLASLPHHHLGALTTNSQKTAVGQIQARKRKGLSREGKSPVWSAGSNSGSGASCSLSLSWGTKGIRTHQPPFSRLWAARGLWDESWGLELLLRVGGANSSWSRAADGWRELAMSV